MVEQSDGARFVHAQPGDGRQELVMEMMGAIQQALTAFVLAAPDPRDGIAMTITAANMFAGARWGAMLHMGEVTTQDTKRGADLAARNFREGIKIGLAHAKRVEIELHGAGQA